jgi:hypothetical protein
MCERINRPNRDEDLVRYSDLYRFGMRLFTSNTREPKKRAELRRDEDQKQTNASLLPRMNSS